MAAVHHNDETNDDYPGDIINPPAEPIVIPATQEDECTLLTCRLIDPAISNVPFVEREVLVKNRGGDRAYWLREEICEAQFGVVRSAVILKRCEERTHDTDWIVTGEMCAVKQMSRDMIRRSRRAEDPIREINVMGYMSRALIPEVNDRSDPDVVRATMDRTRVMLPLDVPLTTETFLYAVMPYCEGGELFAKLRTLSENDARNYFSQILTGIDTLQKLGLCHRDISLENVLVHGTHCYVVDYGMTCRIPYTNVRDYDEWTPPPQRGERRLITPSGRMGKRRYMSPEIWADVDPFDGHAVDLYSVGAVLFMMMAGGPGWELPQEHTDRGYRVITSGRLAELLRYWNIQLSEDCVDLLQRMVLIPPQRRLSLAQIRNHAWMQGPAEAPEA